MRLLTLLLFTLLCTCVRAQTGEFEIHNNGYIYPEATMTDLAFIVDSLDLKFKQCDLDRAYLAPAQTMASHYTVDTKNWKSVRDRLTKAAAKGQVDVKALYPTAELTRRGILYVSNGSERKPGRQFNLLPLNYGNSLTIQPGDDNASSVTELVYVSKGYKDTKIWVLDAEPAAREIPETYARMIQYVDCMVDTSQLIYLEGSATETGGYLRTETSLEGQANFIELINEFEETAPKYDVKSEDDPDYSQWSEWQKEMTAWTTAKMTWVNRMIEEDQRFSKAFEELKTTVENGESVIEELEYYLEIQGEYALALKSKRLRQVWGSCSQDNSPRIHAAQIARLSAAAVEWPVFLRAHLNIMNDRFDRASDGSYAYASRGTYLAELEALGIDATGLLIGSCLRAEELSGNHYQSNWSRVGRALTEAEDSDAVVAILTDIIRDPKLDDMNRMTGVYLLRFMASNHGKEEADKRYTLALATAVAGLEADWAKLVKVE